MKKQLSFIFVLVFTFVFSVAGMESGQRIIRDDGSSGRFITSISASGTIIIGTYINSTGTGTVTTIVRKRVGKDFKTEDVICMSRENRGVFSLFIIMNPEREIVVELKRLILVMEGKEELLRKNVLRAWQHD
jgi:hypothetical protein